MIIALWTTKNVVASLKVHGMHALNEYWDSVDNIWKSWSASRPRGHKYGAAQASSSEISNVLKVINNSQMAKPDIQWSSRAMQQWK